VIRLRIMHTCLNVMDLDRSIAFYRDRLGLKLTRRVEIKENNAEIAFVEDPDGNAIELTHWRDKKQLTEGDNFDHIALGVEDLNATIERFRAQGVTIAMEPFKLKGGAHPIAFIKDPDGNWLELTEE
jgi:lactoylglutathione lyase